MSVVKCSIVSVSVVKCSIAFSCAVFSNHVIPAAASFGHNNNLIVLEMDFRGKPAVGVKMDEILIKIWHSSASRLAVETF